MNPFSAAIRVLSSIMRAVWSPLQTLGLRFDPSFPAWSRKQERTRRNLFKRMSRLVPTGAPHLTGARLARTIEACSPRHLTAQPRYLRAEWERVFEE